MSEEGSAYRHSSGRRAPSFNEGPDEEYERACFEAVAKRLERADLRPIELRSLRLEGAYPETRIVAFVTKDPGRRAELHWQIWRDRYSGEAGPDHPLEPPDEVALAFWIQVDEW